MQGQGKLTPSPARWPCPKAAGRPALEPGPRLCQQPLYRENEPAGGNGRHAAQLSLSGPESQLPPHPPSCPQAAAQTER